MARKIKYLCIKLINKHNLTLFSQKRADYSKSENVKVETEIKKEVNQVTKIERVDSY